MTKSEFQSYQPNQDIIHAALPTNMVEGLHEDTDVAEQTHQPDPDSVTKNVETKDRPLVINFGVQLMKVLDQKHPIAVDKLRHRNTGKGKQKSREHALKQKGIFEKHWKQDDRENPDRETYEDVIIEEGQTASSLNKKIARQRRTAERNYRLHRKEALHDQIVADKDTRALQARLADNMDPLVGSKYDVIAEGTNTSADNIERLAQALLKFGEFGKYKEAHLPQFQDVIRPISVLINEIKQYVSFSEDTPTDELQDDPRLTASPRADLSAKDLGILRNKKLNEIKTKINIQLKKLSETLTQLEPIIANRATRLRPDPLLITKKETIHTHRGEISVDRNYWNTGADEDFEGQYHALLADTESPERVYEIFRLLKKRLEQYADALQKFKWETIEEKKTRWATQKDAYTAQYNEAFHPRNPKPFATNKIGADGKPEMWQSEAMSLPQRVDRMTQSIDDLWQKTDLGQKFSLEKIQIVKETWSRLIRQIFDNTSPKDKITYTTLIDDLTKSATEQLAQESIYSESQKKHLLDIFVQILYKECVSHTGRSTPNDLHAIGKETELLAYEKQRSDLCETLKKHIESISDISVRTDNTYTYARDFAGNREAALRSEISGVVVSLESLFRKAQELKDTGLGLKMNVSFLTKIHLKSIKKLYEQVDAHFALLGDAGMIKINRRGKGARYQLLDTPVKPASHNLRRKQKKQ